MKTLYTSLLLLSLLSSASAELPFKKKPQEFQTRVPAEVAHTLQEGSAVQRNDLALELGIYAPNPSSGAVKSNAPCVDFSHMDERQVKLRADAENALLIADSSVCDSTYLVIFDKAPKSEWRHVQTIRLSARTGRPEITYAELIQPGVSEILVYHEMTSESGTYSQQDFVVLKLLRDRVEVILDTTQTQRNHADEPSSQRYDQPSSDPNINLQCDEGPSQFGGAISDSGERGDHRQSGEPHPLPHLDVGSWAGAFSSGSVRRGRCHARASSAEETRGPAFKAGPQVAGNR